jgi:hypothetical protein
MKKILLLLLTASANSQALFDKGIKITGGISTENTATKVVGWYKQCIKLSQKRFSKRKETLLRLIYPLQAAGRIYITNIDNRLYRWNVPFT